LAEAGATVCAAARSLDQLEQFAAILRGRGHKCHAFALDVSSPASIREFSARAVEAHGPPSILVNNAGIGKFTDIEVMSDEDFEQQIAVNLRGPWYMMREVVPHLKRAGAGSIINIGSIAGTVSFRRGSAYCAAKAGLRAMSDAIFQEVRDSGVRVTLLSLGSVDTGFHALAMPAGHHADQTWMLEPDAVADAVLHVLASPPSTVVSQCELRPLYVGKPGANLPPSNRVS